MPRKWDGESAMEIAERLGYYDIWSGLEPRVCWPEDEAYEKQKQKELDEEGE